MLLNRAVTEPHCPWQHTSNHNVTGGAALSIKPSPAWIQWTLSAIAMPLLTSPNLLLLLLLLLSFCSPGLPYKGYDERAPTDGYLAAAGLNEMMTAPLVASQKGSYDWEESINAITRHAIEEFSNLQHFVPYLYEKCNLLGKAGINWIPTLGTWMQYNKLSLNDGNSISFYHMLEAMAKLQVPINSTHHTETVNKAVDLVNATWLHVTKAAEEKNIALAQTYVPKSNLLTQLAYQTNKARGAHPEADVTMRGVAKSVVSQMSNGSVDIDSHNEAVNNGIHAAFQKTAVSFSIQKADSSNSSGNATGWVHKMGKGMGKLLANGVASVTSITVVNSTFG